MKQLLAHIALVVRDYDEVIAFYTGKLRFKLLEDTYQPEQDKRWVVVAPRGAIGATLLLAKASTPQQMAFIGDQAGGRVFLFLATNDFWRDHRALLANGVEFVREPKSEGYGTEGRGLQRFVWQSLGFDSIRAGSPDAGATRVTLEDSSL